MSITFPYTLQPQPPLLPKTTGGKRGPSAPHCVITSHNDNEENDSSTTEHTSPVAGRLTAHDFFSSSLGSKTNVITVSSLPNPQNYYPSRKSGLPLPHQRSSSNNNNVGMVNLNLAAAMNSDSGSTSSTVDSISNAQSDSFENSVSMTALTAVCNNIMSLNSTSSVEININQGNSSTNTSLMNALSGASSITSADTGQQAVTNETDVSCMSNSTTQSATSSSGANTASLSSSDFGSHPIPVSVCSSPVKEMRSESPDIQRDRSSSPFSNFAYEHDHDYDNVASPCSSTASGPIYVRPPGFKHHAQEIMAQPTGNKLKKKKCSTTLINLREGFKKRESTPPKLKPKREPLPMKLRALPQSFWQQPNVAHQVSPAMLFPILPPLPNKDTEDVMMDIRPVTPPDERDNLKKSHTSDRKLTIANTDLLFKLFEGIGEEKRICQSSTRTKPPKSRKPIPKSNTKGLFLGNDPYMVDAVTDNIFPQLTLEGSKHSSGGLQLITLKEGDKTVTLPALSMEQSYPQMLSELVMHI